MKIKEERKNCRKVSNDGIIEEKIRERLDFINKSQDKYKYELKIDTNSLLEYSLNIRYNIGDTIIATRGFFDKIELLAHIKGLEEFLQFMV